MTLRTSIQTVVFKNDFSLPGYSKPLPAGAYKVEIEEELLENLSFIAWRRTQASFYLPGRPGITEILALDPKEIDAARTRDSARQEKSRATARPDISGTRNDDRHAIERAENEGMLWVGAQKANRLRPVCAADFANNDAR